MKRLLSIFSLFLFFADIAFPQYTYRELLHLPWGSGDLEVGFRKGPGGQFGPMSFAVKSDTILLLDTQNKSLKIIKNNVLLNQLQLPPQNADDFVWQNSHHYFLLSDNTLFEFDNQKMTNSYQPDSPQILITSLMHDRLGNVHAVLNDAYSVSPVKGKLLSHTLHKNSATSDDDFIQVIKKDWRTFEIIQSNHVMFKITTTGPKFGAAKFLGRTLDGDLYIYLEKIVQQVPLHVDREIRRYTLTGEIRARFLAPTHAHTYIFKEFFVDGQGNLFQLITSEDGVYVIGWYQIGVDFQDRPEYEYPPKFQKFYHYNSIDSDEAQLANGDNEKINDDVNSTSELFSVTRQEALDIGDSYVQHYWTATADNITPGRILDPDGVEIETPAWIQVGLNVKVPYQWGGFSTLEQFDQGLVNGKYAGDQATTGVSAYCVGVDCSGFVSRCWKLSYHYSTRMMDDYIAQPYNSWFDLLPADAIHRPGHVRLFVDFNPNGSLLAVESTAKTTWWRVGYFSYTLSDLTSYIPRYYINMEGAPGTVPKPELNYIAFADSVNVSYQIAESNSIAGFKIYTTETDDNWTAGEIIQTAVRKLTLKLNDNVPQFFRLTSVSSSDENVESFPTDAYGYYHTGSRDKILIVDGFDRMSGSYPFPYHIFAMTTGKALSHFNYSFESTSNDALIDGKIHLKDYPAVIWLLGDESTKDETFNTTEQHLIKSYLQQGGKIFITGSEIAWDLDEQGSASDKDFIHSFLKTAYQIDDSENYIVKGESGTVFDGLTLHYDDGTKGIYEEDYPDVFCTANGSYAAMRYANGLIAATAFEGTVPDGTNPAKIVVMGFPFETIYDETERIALVGKVVSFFDLSPTPIADDQTAKSLQFVLEQNYPNPFNSSTVIAYHLPQNEKVSLKIYNLKGEQARILVDKNQLAGDYTIYWDGTNSLGQNVASGLYIYQIETGNEIESKKMMLLH